MFAARNLLLAHQAPTVAPSFDALGAGKASLSTSGSWSHNAKAGAWVFGLVACDSGKAATSATYGGHAMTLLGPYYFNNNSGLGALSVFYLPSVTGGAQTLAVSMNGGTYFVGNSVSYNNVTSIGTPVEAYGSGNASQALTCAAGQLILHGFGCGANVGGGVFSSPSGGNTRYNGAEGSYTGLVISDAAASATFAAATGTDWAGAGLVLS
ncbi:hypothetical protein KXD96_28125 (plasmid) [Mycobacterium sp. SMC-2]|uniref:hypothetical protein n=1 Tax=Mycobacterium sp. SMC-2 TaxID=2857058 RepID=UPI0021B411E7|nr:hypothetical protein [Mycobacterium sp. SMC-2]UXA09630.1 hypothetical protein KXD96_28125 [Mycobacterium sp. SMC-2]